MLDELFSASREQKRSVTVFLPGATLAGLVVRIENGWIELRNQQYGRIVIRIDRIDGASFV